MARPEVRRRLIVNADDFGRSRSINQAVIRAHREGILTSASLMVNEAARDEAVALARENPRLGVGLHLALVCGRSALSCERIPGLVDARGEFSADPVRTGLNYFFQRGLRTQIEDELAAQFARFRATGLQMDHVNGHLHMHLHPVVFDILLHRAVDWGLARIRLTRDEFWLNARLARGRWLSRLAHAVIYRTLSGRSRRRLMRRGIRFTPRVFGLLQNARVDESFVLGLLARLPAGDSELYSHPSLDEFRHEFEALISPEVRQCVAEHGIELIRYADL